MISLEPRQTYVYAYVCIYSKGSQCLHPHVVIAAAFSPRACRHVTRRRIPIEHHMRIDNNAEETVPE